MREENPEDSQTTATPADRDNRLVSELVDDANELVWATDRSGMRLSSNTQQPHATAGHPVRSHQVTASSVISNSTRSR